MKIKFKQYDKVLCINPKILDPYYKVPIMDWQLTIDSIATVSPLMQGTYAILATGKYLNNDPKNHEIRYSVLTKDLNHKNFISAQVRCDSGLIGWRDFAQNVYESFEELERFSEIYGVAKRLGYDDASELWKDNPIIQGSTNPSDLKIVWKRQN